MPHESAFRRLAWWMGIVAAFTLLGWIGGTVFGNALARISYDYIVVPSDFTDAGLRLGVLVGAILAASQMAGRRSTATPTSVVLAAGLVVTTLGVVTAVGGAAAWALFGLDILDTSAWQIAHPRRHAVCLGLQYGAFWGTLLAAAAGSVFLWSRRRVPHVA